MPATTYNCLNPQERAEGLAAAAEVLRNGDNVVLPTDTVYGCLLYTSDAADEG